MSTSAKTENVGEDNAESEGRTCSSQQHITTTECGEITELESLCPKCEKNGTTRLMITQIPHFREIIISSFDCPHCGERNNEVQFGGKFGEFHTKFELAVGDAEDLNRQVVKSEYATVCIPELGFEIPPGSQKGSVTTIEGMLMVAIDGLQHQQPVRRIMEPEIAAKIDSVCEKLEQCRTGQHPFTFVVDDPAGNSYIESYYSHYHPTIDPKLKKTFEKRTDIERQMLGLAVEYNQQQRTEEEQRRVEEGNLDDKVVEIEQECPACTKLGMLRCHKCDIPYFKETLIMCYKCDHCGYKSTEIKNGGGVAPKGRKLILSVTKSDDLKRDVLKSDTTTVLVPEIGLELAAGTLGGFFTTVEGLLSQVYDGLAGMNQVAFETGDSKKCDPHRGQEEAIEEGQEEGGANSLQSFLGKLATLRDGKRYPFTLVLDDPLSNVYIQNPRAHLPPPDNEDPHLVCEEYTRSEEQEEQFGLNDLRALEEETVATASGNSTQQQESEEA